MKRSNIILLALVVIAVAGMVTYFAMQKGEEADAVEAKEAAAQAEAEKLDNTDAGKDFKATLKGAADAFSGYYFYRSPYLQKLMRRSNYRVIITDDFANGDGYKERFEKLAAGEYDFVVATVDSDILNSAQLNFPGVITMIGDVSKGADCVLALKEMGEELDDFRGEEFRIALTPDSPTEHVLKNVKAHFGIAEFHPPKGSPLRVETKGSEEALQLLIDRKVKVAGVWEPQCSQGKARDDIVEVFSTKDTEGYVVDVLIWNRKFLADNLPLVRKFQENYFRTLKFYFDNPDNLVAELKKETGLSEDLVKAVIDGIAWQNLTDNATRWFGIALPGEDADEYIVSVIESTVKVLMQNGDFQKNPLPEDGNPYAIFYPDIIEDLYKMGLDATSGGPAGLVKASFSQLPPERWAQLSSKGNLKVPPIEFMGGDYILTFVGNQQLDSLAADLKHFPSYRIMVIGHTSAGGDESVNQELSLKRAQAVIQYLTMVHDYDPNRCLAVGKGGSEPLSKEIGEDPRRWRKRQKRVQIVLKKEVF